MRRRTARKRASRTALYLLIVLEDSVASPAKEAGEQSLDSQAGAPTSSLMSLQLQGFYAPNLHKSDESQNTVQFRTSIPFQISGINNIARLTLSYVTQSLSGRTGLGDATLFNLFARDRNRACIGIGAVALLPTGESGISAEKWGLGPAFGFVERRVWGLFGQFNHNILTVAGDNDRPNVNISIIQPILSHPLENGRSVGASDMNIIYDRDADEFTNLTLGLKVSKPAKMGGRPVQIQSSYERNIYEDRAGPEDTIGFTVKILVPR